MQSFWFPLFLAVSNAVSLTTVSVSDRDDSIRAPILVSLTAQDRYGFTLKWEPVKSDETNPVLGYKVKIWEQPKNKVYRYENIEGAQVLVKENEGVIFTKFPLNEVPQYEPKEVLTTKADVHEASSSGMEPGVVYEFRVQAYTKNGDGPLSAPMRLQYLKSDSNDDKDMYTVA